MEAPTDLPAALVRIELILKEVDRKEEETKRLRTNGGKMKELVRYREENEKRIEREKLKEEVKREIIKSQQETEETRRRIWREEREMREYYNTATTTTLKRYRHED